MSAEKPDEPAEIDERRLRHVLATVPLDRLREVGVLDRLVELAATSAPNPAPARDEPAADLASMDVADLVARAMGTRPAQLTEQETS
jgi:hypothetical protein